METIFAQFLKDKTYIGNVTPETISFYKQSFNALKLAVTKLKKEKKIVKTLTEVQLRAIINFKPQDFFGHRTHTLDSLLGTTIAYAVHNGALPLLAMINAGDLITEAVAMASV